MRRGRALRRSSSSRLPRCSSACLACFRCADSSLHRACSFASCAQHKPVSCWCGGAARTGAACRAHLLLRGVIRLGGQLLLQLPDRRQARGRLSPGHTQRLLCTSQRNLRGLQAQRLCQRLTDCLTLNACSQQRHLGHPDSWRGRVVRCCCQSRGPLSGGAKRLSLSSLPLW